jgi:pimeloyl-ACP methyl ester carboxylesterase
VALVLATAACGEAPPGRAASETGDAGRTDDLAPRTIEIRVGDLVFDARSAGPESGEAVFLLHGFPQTSYEWRAQLPALARAGYHAIAPDQRGYSPRARPAEVGEYSVVKLAADVTGMADALGIERFHVVGHDWGAAVAWAVAGLFPERILSAAPISVPHPDAFAQVLSDTTSCQYRASAYFDFFVTPEATGFFIDNDRAGLRAVYEGIPAEDAGVYVEALGTREAIDGGLNWYRANVENRRIDAPSLGPTRVPTLFVWSDGDAFLCRDGAELTESFVEAPYRFEIIGGVNHWVADLAPEQLNGLLLEHLGSLQGGG